MRHTLVGSFVFLVALILAACGGAGSNKAPADPPTLSATSCPSPPVIPTPIPAWLDYPPSGSANVATSVGQVIEKGADEPGQNSLTIVVTSQSGGNVPVGAPTAAPSPLPTPFATPPPNYPITGPYVAIPLPTLSPSTTYDVSDAYTGYSNTPPQCSAQYLQSVGSFTTGP